MGMDERVTQLAQLLVDQGLTHAFGVTGSGSSWALITELERLGVRYYPAAHEASAAIMAGAVCRVTGRPSVSISIKGPGLANMLPGMIYNRFEGCPALSVSEAYSDDAPSFRMHKRLDHRVLIAPVVKATTTLDHIDEELPRLVRLAAQEIPGPVHIDLCHRGTEDAPPLRVQESEGETSVTDRRADVIRLVQQAQRPVLVVGSLATRRPWASRLASLRIPVLTTVAAKGVLDERLPQSAGVFTGDGKALAPESWLFDDADLVVGIGLRNTEVLSPRPFGKPTVLLDEVEARFAEGFGAEVVWEWMLLASAGEVLEALHGKDWGFEQVAERRRVLEHALVNGQWLPSVCFGVLNRLEPPYAVVLDTGSFCTIGEHLLQAGPDRVVLGSSNSRAMGCAIPTAVGVALSKPGWPVYCVVGDGGMRMYPAELRLAVHKRLPLCVMLMTDGRYGSIACVPQPRPMSERAVTIPETSWWETMDAWGYAASTVDSQEEVAEQLSAWDRRGPLFIQAAFDPVPYAEMTAQLR